MIIILFFFKKKTAYELRISDWSSDVCSSDLPEIAPTMSKALSLRTSSAPIKVIDAADSLYTGSNSPIGDFEYEDFIAGGDPEFAWELPGNEWDAIALNYTSGTTGNPKGVV